MSADTVASVGLSGFEIAAGNSTTTIIAAMSVRMRRIGVGRKIGAAATDETVQ